MLRLGCIPYLELHQVQASASWRRDWQKALYRARGQVSLWVPVSGLLLHAVRTVSRWTISQCTIMSLMLPPVFGLTAGRGMHRAVPIPTICMLADSHTASNRHQVYVCIMWGGHMGTQQICVTKCCAPVCLPATVEVITHACMLSQ